MSGVEVSLDDFGSGYSSLSQLVSIPAGILKIDRSLISGLDDGTAQAAAAVAAVVSLGPGLRHADTRRGRSRPRGSWTRPPSSGCTFAQGFHIARPMPADELTAWLSGAGIDACSAPRAGSRRRRTLTPSRSALPSIDVAADFSVVLDELNTTLKSIEAVLRIDDMRNEIADLEQQAAAPDLWNDVEAAQAITSKLSYLQGDLRRVEELRSRLDDVALMHEMAEEENDEATTAETERELTSIRAVIDELEVRTLLSGEYDSREALVTIRSEAGGVDAADWAEMLMRMYLRWAERHEYPTEVYDVSYAEEAGIKSATFAVKHPYAYGTLSVEQGTHRLVRISPFDNQGRRQTVVRRRRGAPGRRADRPRRDPGERDPGRRLPLLRARRAEREHHRLRRPDHPHPDRHRGVLPEREVPDPEPGRRAAGAAGPAARRAPGRSSGPRWTRSRARAAAGATRCAPTSCTRTRWSRTCGPSTRPATPPRCCDGDIDALHRGRHPLAPSAGDRRRELAGDHAVERLSQLTGEVRKRLSAVHRRTRRGGAGGR